MLDRLTNQSVSAKEEEGRNFSLESGFYNFANIKFSVGKQNCDIRSVPVNTVIRHEAGSHFILDFTIK